MAPNELDVRTLGKPGKHPAIVAAYAEPEAVDQRRQAIVPEPGESPARQAI